MKNISISLPVVFLFLIGMVDVGQGTTSISCPDIAYMGTSAVITCITSVPFTTLQYRRPSGGVFPQCSVSGLQCTPVHGYTANVHNSTHSTLKILSVQPTDKGLWTCADARSKSEASCSLFITNVPQCSIRSKQNTDTLTLHEELSLTVNIQEYYCSAQYTFSLLVGEGNVELPISNTVNTPTSAEALTTFNITSSFLGRLRLAFRCHGEQEILSCDGINFINVSPRCRIASNMAIEAVPLHKELELSVNIQNYLCSSANNFTLLVGKVRRPLSADATGNRLSSTTVNTTLSITDLHFGDLRLIFHCQNQTHVLSCDGLESIKGIRAPTTIPTRNTTITPTQPSASITGIVAALVSFIGIVVVSLVVVLCCYRLRGNKSGMTLAYSLEETADNPVYIATESKQVEA